MVENFILVRSASTVYQGGINPRLSDIGKKEALCLANEIKKILNGNSNVTIWTSSSNASKETAEIIKEVISSNELVEYKELWCRVNTASEDFDWLEKKLKIDSQGENLIIVAELEYVQRFPRIFGFSGNGSMPGEGVLMKTKEHVLTKIEIEIED